MTNKISITVIVVLTLFLGLFIGAKYPEKQAVDEDVINNSEEADVLDTKNWLTYKNDTMGFQLKYPDTYEVIENVDFRDAKVPVFVRERNKDTFDSNISIQRTKSIFNKEIAERFYLGLTSVVQNQNLNSGISYIFSYFTGDAYYSHKTFLFTAQQPASPDDKTNVDSDVLVAEVEGVRPEINKNSVVEDIASTIELLPLAVYQ